MNFLDFLRFFGIFQFLDHFWQFLDFWCFSMDFLDFCRFFFDFFFGFFLDILNFLDYFEFSDFFKFFGFFFSILSFFLVSFKVNKVTTKCYHGYYWTPKIAKNGPKQQKKLFFCPKGKKASAEGQSPPQELEVGPRSGRYLLVHYKRWNTEI